MAFPPRPFSPPRRPRAACSPSQLKGRSGAKQYNDTIGDLHRNRLAQGNFPMQGNCVWPRRGRNLAPPDGRQLIQFSRQARM